MPIMTRQHLKLRNYDRARLERLSGRMRNALHFDSPHSMPTYRNPPLSVSWMLVAVGLEGAETGESHTMRDLRRKPLKPGQNRWLEDGVLPMMADIENLIDRQVSQRVQAEVRQAFNPLLDQTRAITDMLTSHVGWHWGCLARPLWEMFLFYAQAGVLFTQRMRQLIDAGTDLCRQTGPFLIRDGVVLTTDMIPQVRFDDQGRIHSEIHPAIDFGTNDAKLYAWRGLMVPAQWITNPKYLTAKRALSYSNAELRRAACEKLGWTHILKELEGRILDHHVNPEIGTLVQVDWHGRPENFLKVRCGTGREFAIPVPSHCTNALVANAWTYGKTPWGFNIPEVRT